MKSTVVVYGSSTGTCQSIAEQIASKLGVEALEVTNLTADVVAANEIFCLELQHGVQANCKTTGMTV